MLRIDYNVIFTVINILILYALLRRFLFKPVRAILAKRKQELDQAYQEADAAREEAGRLQQEAEKRLSGIDQEKRSAEAEARRQASLEYERIVGEAKKESDRICAEAREKAAAAANKERQKAEEEIILMVKKAAGRIAESESDSRMYDDFLQDIAAQDNRKDNKEENDES